MRKIVIENIRNIQQLSFNIPNPGLYILTGKNGSGKTTLFTCISRICNNNAYRLGFPTSESVGLDRFTGSITYTSDNSTVTYTKRPNGKWRANVRNSSTFREFGYPQIVNVTTKNERLFTQETINPRTRLSPDTWLNEKLNQIFDSNKFSTMVRIVTGDLRGRGGTAVNRRRNTAYAIPREEGGYYTEQNFSFGEIVLINLLHDVKNASNGALILIDELELALHPAAQIRLVSALKELSAEKGLTILISTHSSSIIKAQKNVIFLDADSENNVDVIYDCPPAKAIGAIGMREDTNPDIIILVEDEMAKSYFHALQQKYISLQEQENYLDIRILELGGFSNVIHFYIEATNYVFYDNVYVDAYLDKDVETDIIPYPQFGNHDLIDDYNENSQHLRFLPYTPEVFLTKILREKRAELLRFLKDTYGNQQIHYNVPDGFDFEQYEADFPAFENDVAYNAFIKQRGSFRKSCKDAAEEIVESIADQINQSTGEIYRLIFKFAVDHDETGIDVRPLLAPTMKRLVR